MTLHSTTAETAAVRAAIQRSPLVKSFTFLTQADALREFRRLFADQPDLIATTTTDQLPASFPVELNDPGERALFARALQRRAGVDEIKTSSLPDCQELHREFRRVRPVDEVEAFMTMAATEADLAAVRSAIHASPLVRTFVYLSHDDAYREFQRIFADKPKLVARTTPDQLPVSFRIRLVDASNREQLAAELRQLPAVDQVMLQPNDTYTQTLLAVLRGCQQQQ